MAQPDQEQKRHPRFKLLLKVAGGLMLLLLILLLVVAVGLAGLLGSEPGRLWLLDKGIELGGFDAGPMQITIDGARSPALGEWFFDRITVTRQQDLWLDIRKLHLAWQPGELLQRRILVEELSAERLDIHTNARAPSKAPEPQQKEGAGALPSIAVESFHMDRLNIISESLSIPDYRIAGNLRLFWDKLPLKLDLDIRSLPEAGQQPMALVIDSTAKSRNRLLIQGSLEEAAGGMLGQLAQLPQSSPIDLDFEVVVETEADGYNLSLRELRMPFLQRTLGASGNIHIDEGLQKLRIDNLRLRTGAKTHHISGTASADNIDLDLQLDEFPLDLLSPWVPQIEGGSLSADVAAVGAPTDPRISGRLSGSSRYGGHPVALRAAGRFSRQQLDFDHLSANFGTAELEAKGRLDLQGDNSDLNVSLRELPIEYATLFGLEIPKGLSARLVTVEGRLTGNYRKPSGKMTAQAEGSYRQRTFTARATAEGDLGRIQLRSADIRMDDAYLRAQGVIDLEGAESDLKVTLNAIPLSLAELAGLTLPPQLHAEMGGNAHITGELTSPQVSGEVSATGSYREQSFNLVAQGAGSTQQFTLQRARAEIGQATLSAEGTADLAAKRLDMDITLNEAPLDLLELARIQLPDGLMAELSGSASVHGPLTTPEVVSELTVRGSYRDLPFELTANGSLLDRRIDLAQVSLKLDGATALKIEGYLHPDSYDLQLAINNLPSRALSAIGLKMVRGEFSGNLHIKGTPDAPDIAGSFIYNGRLAGIDLTTGEPTTFELGWQTELNTRDQVLYLESAFTRNQRRTGTLEFSAPITRYLNHFQQAGAAGDFPIAFSAKGAIDLAVLSLVLDPDIHRISGRAAVRMEGAGDLANPNLNGVFEMMNSRYENTLTGTVLSDIQLLLKSHGTRITIAEASAQGNGNGRLSADGTINWQNPESRNAVDVTLSADSANLLNREDLDGEISGELTLTGSFDELWLKGELSVMPLSANIDAALRSHIPEIEVTEVYGEPGEATDETPVAASVAPTVHLDLIIKAEQQAYLRGRGLEAELSGEIHLGGTLANPNYEGEFNVIRGVFEVFGRKFNLLEGEALFANNAIYLRVAGEYEHEDHTIRAELSGTTEDLSLDLTSVPDLPEDEILSLLIFGESVQDITPFQAIQLATAVQSLRGGGGGFDPIDFTRDKLGVDTLSIESASTDSGTGVSVGVGKYINERVYLEVKRTPSEIQPWQGTVEIQLSPRLHLRSTTGGEGRTRADLLWKRDF